MGKRFFDIMVSGVFLFLVFIPMVFIWIGTSIETRSNGIFFQKRVGRNGKLFTIFKFKTMRPIKGEDKQKIGRLGGILRRYKIDEWPQLVNIIIGDMSIVGPRPDLIGYYDTLKGEDRKVLQLRPGLTSKASLKYYNEEFLLVQQEDPERYNIEVIFPDKVKMNLAYLKEKSMKEDLKIILETIKMFCKI